MDNRVEDLVRQVENIKNQIQEKGYVDKDTHKSLESEVMKLKEMVLSLDKDFAVNAEKSSAIYVQLEMLDEKIDDLKNNSKTSSDKKRDSTEKILLLVLGAILSFVFNKFT